MWLLDAYEAYDGRELYRIVISPSNIIECPDLEIAKRLVEAHNATDAAVEIAEQKKRFVEAHDALVKLHERALNHLRKELTMAHQKIDALRMEISTLESLQN